MPHRRNRGPHKVVGDPLTACLDADGTYICTAYNSRCYIIQKVTPNTSSVGLNPEADVFQSKVKPGDGTCWDFFEPDFSLLDGYVYMNGDVGKLPSGAVYPATPEPLAAPTSTTDYSTLNGVVDPLETYSDVAAPPGGSAAEPPPSSEPTPATVPTPTSAHGIPLDQLKQMLSSQLEYYFSRENLASDTYLLSQMDNDQYVPIWTVANFNQVKKLTKDIKLITEVLRESPNVQVDEEGQKVRPNHKRCIVILREIPDSTPLEDVKGLFSGKGCPRLISCEFAHNNSWYVTFESDEDAQRAYRFLREEVREFQGKPIMARIKAKPMNRLPIPPVAPGLGAMKNGYRTPPAAAATAPVFDPAAYQTAQQRLVYTTNGSSFPPNYGNQVQIYTFQQQPFYPPNMLPPWGPTSPAYFDVGSMFSLNGLAPQGSFAKAPSSRFMPGTRSNRSKRGQMSSTDHRSTVSDSGVARSHINVSSGGGKNVTKAVESHHNHTVNVTTSTAGGSGKNHYQRESTALENTENITRPVENEDAFRQNVVPPKDAMPPRRRRKDDENRVSGSPGPIPVAPSLPRGPQFDLEADAFPPLPGLEVAAPQPSPAPLAKAVPVEIQTTTTPVEPTSQSHWENRLSDVVKGTAKGKPGPVVGQTATISAVNVAVSAGSNCTKEKESGSPRPRSATPPITPAPSHLPPPLPLPTPPPTPEKTVPVTALAAKCCTADKSTKTDDMVLNGVAIELTVNTSETICRPVQPAPMTTNAATMTDVSTSPLLPHSQGGEGTGGTGIVRLSYAQVAQHPKDKQSSGDREREKQSTSCAEDEKKDAPSSTPAQTAPRESASGGRTSGVGRGASRGGTDRERGPRRRDRDNASRFNSRPRSPK